MSQVTPTAAQSRGDTLTRDFFINIVKPWAKKAAAELGVPWEWIATHWGHETGFSLREDNNLAGIGHYDNAEHGRQYESLEEFTEDYVYVLLNEKDSQGNYRYRPALSADSFSEFAQRIKAGGYATDPQYTQKLVNLYNEVFNGQETIPDTNNPPIVDNPPTDPEGNRNWWNTFFDYWGNVFKGDTDKAEEVIKEYEKEKGIAPEDREKNIPAWLKPILNFLKQTGVVIVGVLVIIVSLIFLFLNNFEFAGFSKKEGGNNANT